MSFFESLTGALGGAGEAGTNLRAGTDVAGGVAGLTSVLLSSGVRKEVAKTDALAAKINAKRVARSMRYQQGLAAASNAGAGNSQFGSYLSVVADNARAARENIESGLLSNKLKAIDDKASTPSLFEAGLGFVGSLAKANADRAVKNKDY